MKGFEVCVGIHAHFQDFHSLLLYNQIINDRASGFCEQWAIIETCITYNVLCSIREKSFKLSIVSASFNLVLFGRDQ